MPSSYYDSEVSWFLSCKATEPDKSFPLDQIIDWIKNGQYRNDIETIREIYREEGKSARYKAAKEKLPCLAVSGIIQKRSKLIQHSEFIQIDIDNINGESPLELKGRIIKDDFVRCCFISPSGLGLKVFIKINPEKHKESFDALSRYYQTQFGIKVDSSQSHVKALCFISYDPAIYDDPFPSVYELPNVIQTVIQKNFSSSSSKPSSLYNKATLYNKRIYPDELWKDLKKQHSALPKLFKDRVIPYLPENMSGNHNDTLVNIVAFQYHAFSPKIIYLFMDSVYDLFIDHINATKEKHRTQVASMLKSLEESYLSGLSPDEKNIYQGLSSREQDVFRICRSLAFDVKDSLPGQFFLSCNQLAARIGLKYDMAAGRLIFKLRQVGLIEIIKKGEQGIGKDATSYQWILR